MSLSLFDVLVIVAFFIVSTGIALFFRKQAGQNLESFFLGGRNLPWWIAGVSMVATTFAADTPLAVTELIAKNGISGNWLWWNMLAGGMLTTFFFARYWRKAGIVTDVEFVELRYSGKAASFLRGFKAIYMGVFLNSIIIGWVNLALISILEVFFGIDYSTSLIIILLAMLLVSAYSSLSGLLGVAFTDLIQFVVAMAGVIFLAIVVVNRPEIGGIEGLKSKLPESSFQYFPQISSDTIGYTLSLSLGSFLAYIGVMWWASWYPGNEPGGGGYIAQRMMSTKNEKHAVGSVLFFQIGHYALRPWPWIIVALCTLVLYPDLAESDKKLGYVMAIKDYMPNGLKGLLLAAFFAAYMSTISTQLNWGASYLVNDFYKRFFKPNSTEKEQVLFSRTATFVLMLVALFATTQMDSISGVWSFLMECGAGIGLVLILRWYWWRINAWSEIAASIAPFIGYVLAKYLFKMEFPNSFFVTVGFTTVAWILATYLTQATNDSTLQAFYQRVKPAGAWGKYSEKGQNKSIPFLAIAWLSSISFAYCILFLMGKIIFHEWIASLHYGAIAILSLALLLLVLKKTRIFED